MHCQLTRYPLPYPSTPLCPNPPCVSDGTIGMQRVPHLQPLRQVPHLRQNPLLRALHHSGLPALGAGEGGAERHGQRGAALHHPALLAPALQHL